MYQDLCAHAEIQHLRATALVSPGATPLVCPVDSIVNTHPVRPLVDEITLETLDPCVWRYVLNQDDLARFRLKVRSDVVGSWEIASTTYNHFYCQVKFVVFGTGFKPAIGNWGLKSDQGSVVIEHTRVLLLPPSVSKLTKEAFYWLRIDTTPATGAARAYHESQPRIFKTEAPQFVGAGEGTDNLDFLADLSAPKVIDPDSLSQAIPPGDKPVPRGAHQSFLTS